MVLLAVLLAAARTAAALADLPLSIYRFSLKRVILFWRANRFCRDCVLRSNRCFRVWMLGRTYSLCAVCPCDRAAGSVPQSCTSVVVVKVPLVTRWTARWLRRCEELFGTTKLWGTVFQFSQLLHHSREAVCLALLSRGTICRNAGQPKFCSVMLKVWGYWYICAFDCSTNMWLRGHVGVLVGSQLAACEVCRLVLIRLLTAWPWSLSQDEISWLTDSSLSHLIDRGVDRICCHKPSP